MPLNASSEWISNIEGKKPSLDRFYYIGDSDYSQYVIKWPKIKNDWNRMHPNNFTINLANEEKTFNFLRDDSLGYTYETSIEIAQTTAVDSAESIEVFKGKIKSFKYSNGQCAVFIVDRWNELTNRIIGTEGTPQDYTGSNYLPSDLAWYICTSHGGLSSIQSISNPDIDYASFEAWSDVWSSNSIFMKAFFEGDKAVDALRRIGRVTDSAIFTSPDNKIRFTRFSLTDSNTIELDESKIRNISLEVNEDNLINKFYQKADYDVNSEYHKITVFDIDSDSVNSYGLHEETYGDELVWLTTSAGALDTAQRKILQYSSPSDDVIVETTILAIPGLIGETANISDTLIGIDGGYRILNTEIDYDTASMKIKGDRRLFLNGFTLDVSTLDGPDVLT